MTKLGASAAFPPIGLSAIGWSYFDADEARMRVSGFEDRRDGDGRRADPGDGVMTWRLLLMFIGTLACLAPLIVAPGFISRAPMLLSVEFSSLNALMGWAYVLATTLLPVVCIVSVLRGWFAWAGGPRDEALSRLLLWPAVAVFVSAGLYLTGRLLQMQVP